MLVALHGLNDTSYDLRLNILPYLDFDQISKLRGKKQQKLLDDTYTNLNYHRAIIFLLAHDKY